MLASSQGAMLLSAPSDANLKNFVVTNGMPVDSLAVGPVPEGPGGRFALMGGSLDAIAANATEDEIDAAFKWLEFTGSSANMDENGKETYEATIKDKVEAGEPVFSKVVFNIWKSGNTYETKNSILEKYSNANLENYKEYMNFDGVTIKAEEPVNCQDLYSTLDNCIQEVLENKDADIKAILSQAAKEFQMNFLDNEN